MKSSIFGSVKFVWMSLDYPTRSIRQLQTLKIVSRINVDIFSWDELNKQIKNFYSNVYLAPFGRKFTTGLLKLLVDLIQLIGSTLPKSNVWPNRRSSLYLGRPKLEFGSSHEKFDVWPTLALVISEINENVYGNLKSQCWAIKRNWIEITKSCRFRFQNF